MDNREEVREFLTSRRAKITPEQVDLPAGSRRRVPGLRRSEVAALADMSVEYYAKLERGNLAGASPAVLLARALQLDDAERAHLLNLAQAADGSDALTRPRRRTATRQWTPHRSLQWTLDAITAGPAVVGNGRMDILAANPLARAFYTDLFANGDNQRNLARFNFLDPASRRFYPDRELFADMAVAILRREAGRDPHDKGLHDLIGELSTRSEDFRTRWGAHNVRRRHRHQAVPPPRGRRPHPRLRIPGPGRRTGTQHDHLHRRTRLPLGRRPTPARLPGRHRESGPGGASPHRLKPHRPAWTPSCTCPHEQKETRRAESSRAQIRGGAAVSRILVTGSTDGLGRATAETLLTAGHQVVVHARNPQRATALRPLLDRGADAVTGDLTERDAVRRIAAELNDADPLDVIVHNAGVWSGRAVMPVNIVAPYLLTALLPAPRRLVYLSSGSHFSGRPAAWGVDWLGKSAGSYADSKLFVTTLAAAVARLRPDVRSNAVDPGWVPTRMGGPGAPDDLELGHRTQEWLAISDEPEALTTGGYWYHRRLMQPHRAVHDEAFQDQLLEALAEETGAVL